MKLSSVVVLVVGALAAGAQGQVIVNGSMTGPLAIGSPPPAWNSVNADGDTIGPGGFGGWATGIGPSANGGTFLMVLDNGNGGAFDQCGQTIAGWNVGQNYSVSFEYANGALPAFGNYDNTLEVEMEIFGVDYLTPATLFDGVGNQQWRSITFNFTATAAVTTLYFRCHSLGAGGAAAAIDGVEIVPTPGTFALAGVAGLVTMRRRRRA